MNSALLSAKQELFSKRDMLEDTNSKLEALQGDLAEMQRIIVLEWDGDDDLGVKGVLAMSDEFTKALNNWTPPPEGPDWLKIGLLIGASVLTVAAAIGTGGAALGVAGALGTSGFAGAMVAVTGTSAASAAASATAVTVGLATITTTGVIVSRGAIPSF